jgi:FAD:protein FMN transferase
VIRSIEFRAMNTSVMLAAEGERSVPGMYAAKAFIDECEQRFSRFLPASEIAGLNRSAGEWIHVSPDMMDLLQLSVKYHHATDGLFDPSILPELKHVGYDRSMDEIRARRAVASIPVSKTTSRASFDALTLDPVNHRVRLPRAMELDLGGLAKGWIVEKAAELLHRYVDVCGVSAGGDILFIGRPLDGMDWDVYLEDPRSPTQSLAQLHIPSGAVATSSIMKRTWSQGQIVRHHLIDPRTGEPAETRWLSVTGIASNIVDADVYAKAILIGGETAASRLLEAGLHLTYLAVDSDGNISGSPGCNEYMYDFTTEPI